MNWVSCFLFFFSSDDGVCLFVSCTAKNERFSFRINISEIILILYRERELECWLELCTQCVRFDILNASNTSSKKSIGDIFKFSNFIEIELLVYANSNIKHNLIKYTIFFSQYSSHSSSESCANETVQTNDTNQEYILNERSNQGNNNQTEIERVCVVFTPAIQRTFFNEYLLC